MSECDNSQVVPGFQTAPLEIHALTQDFEENNFVTCGWKKNETVSITLTRPDGSQDTPPRPMTATPPWLQSPHGLWHAVGRLFLALESPSGKVTHDFKVVWPAGPGW